ncbi:MAG: ABC transporter substrate-binding protein [Caldilineaceae bacterium]|nr:ABC transporter substrate-binding protein [Caldilineaceae bacterium]
MKQRYRLFSLLSILLVMALFVGACGSPPSDLPVDDAPAAEAPAAEAPAADAPAADAPAAEASDAEAASGPLLADLPAGPGERETQQEVYNSPADYEAATGNAISEYHEAPVLTALVEAGELPAVEERLPAEPVVIKPEETIGKYGGFVTGPIEGQNMASPTMFNYWRIDPLTTFSPDGSEIIPNLAKGWEISEDNQTITIFLREGVKWSDGEPYTADDILFWWNSIILNDELTPSKPTVLTRGGELAEVTKVDDYTVQFTFSAPYALFVTYLGSWGGPREDPMAMPEHYLSQFHPDFVDMAEIESLMEADGFDSWVDFFQHMIDRHNPDKPTLSAWIPNEWPPQPIQTYRRNPYYWKVDTEGNQLPYIDELRATRVADTEAQLLKTIAGELDWSSLGFNGGVANMPLILENQEKGDYRLVYGTWMPNSFSNIMFNFNHPDEARKELYNDVRFRQALSVAINRDELIKLVWKGAVFASQVAPLYGPPYHGESELFQSYAQFDPELANQLLDEIGLTEHDGEGYRLGLDGEPLLLVIAANSAWPPETPAVMEIIRGYWEEVGIRATVQPEAGELWTARHNGGEHDLSARGAHFGGGPVHPTLNGNTFALGGWQWAPEWALWLDTDGEQGVEPPDDVKRIRELRELILGEPDEAKRVEMINEVFEIHMANLWSIGLVVDDPKINQQTIVKNRVRNVPTWTQGEWYPSLPESWFINE